MYSDNTYIHTVNDVSQETSIDDGHAPLHCLLILLAICTVQR